MSQELPTADGHTPASICSHSPGLLPPLPSTGAQHPLPAHPLASDPWPGPAPLCPLLLTPRPPPQKAGAGTPLLRPPAPFGSPHEPTPAPAPACSPASGHRIRPSTRTPGWTAWTEARSPWSWPCCWPSAASVLQVGVQGPGVGETRPQVLPASSLCPELMHSVAVLGGLDSRRVTNHPSLAGPRTFSP